MNLTNLGRSEKDSYNGCDSNVEVYLFLYQTPHNPSRQSDLCKVQSSNLMVLSLCLCFLLRIVSCVPSPIQSSTISRFVLSVSVFFGWCAGSAVQGASPRISCQESWFFLSASIDLLHFGFLSVSVHLLHCVLCAICSARAS